MAMTPACAFDPLLSPQCAQNLVGKDYFENMYQASKIKFYICMHIYAIMCT